MSEKLTIYFLCQCRIKGWRLTYLKNLLPLLLHDYSKVEDFNEDNFVAKRLICDHVVILFTLVDLQPRCSVWTFVLERSLKSAWIYEWQNRGNRDMSVYVICCYCRSMIADVFWRYLLYTVSCMCCFRRHKKCICCVQHVVSCALLVYMSYSWRYVTGDGSGWVTEPRRIQRLSETVPQHHLWTTSYRRSSRSESTSAAVKSPRCQLL